MVIGFLLGVLVLGWTVYSPVSWMFGNNLLHVGAQSNKIVFILFSLVVCFVFLVVGSFACGKCRNFWGYTCWFLCGWTEYSPVRRIFVINCQIFSYV